MSSSQVLFILLLILLNGFFVLSEMALVSAKRSRLQAAAEQGQSGAKSALALVEDPIQIGITLLTIFTGLYGGETFAGPLAEELTSFGVPAEYTEELAKGIVVVIITFVTLIVGATAARAVATARSSLGILVETHSWRTYKERVQSTYHVLQALFERAATDAPRCCTPKRWQCESHHSCDCSRHSLRRWSGRCATRSMHF